MRRQHSVHSLVYQHLFPNPGPSDPKDFSDHLVRNLITEVRIETQRFYGGLETIEAKYPGLDYSHPPHRKRLGRFPYHARLFLAFDDLGLTRWEIAELCKWEGTAWARQRYEKDEGIKVEDTTGREIKSSSRGHLRPIRPTSRSSPRGSPRIPQQRNMYGYSDRLPCTTVESMPREEAYGQRQFQSPYQTPLQSPRLSSHGSSRISSPERRLPRSAPSFAYQHPQYRIPSLTSNQLVSAGPGISTRRQNLGRSRISTSPDDSGIDCSSSTEERKEGWE